MKKTILLAVSILTLSTSVFASEDAFCRGFEEGYKTVNGDMVIVPICPIEPVTPIDSTSFREGIKKGIEEAQNE